MTKKLKRQERLVDRHRKIATFDSEASRGKSLKARVKILERLEARRIKAPFVDIKQPNIHLKTDNSIEETIALNVNDYSAAFDEVLLNDVNFEIKSTDKVAIIGANGTGKTTLLRDIFKNNSDSIKVHDDIELAYLSQVQGEILDESNTILEEFFEVGFKTKQEILSYVYGYGFGEELIDHKIAPYLRRKISFS